MPRNLYERVEVMFPLKDALARERVRHEILDAYLVDNLKSRVLRKDGVYVRSWQAEGKRKPPTGAAAFSAQDFLLGLAEGKQAVEAMPVPGPRKARRVVMR
jgi:polyphosphate kinase